ncbi:MAG: hypothetical protein J6D03_10590 [Clostridia bacterium]|nr:hypothetical protein [Clostridia bacterium]
MGALIVFTVIISSLVIFTWYKLISETINMYKYNNKYSIFYYGMMYGTILVSCILTGWIIDRMIYIYKLY